MSAIPRPGWSGRRKAIARAVWHRILWTIAALLLVLAYAGIMLLLWLPISVVRTQ